MTSRQDRLDPGVRGFTLIELLVAMTAAMFVAIAAYAMAKQGARFFQQEARIASAQYSVTVGFDRLRTDLSRAAFLSTANVQRDPFVCPPPTGHVGWGALANLAAVRLDDGTVGEDDTLNGLAPEQITLSGSYASAELFPVRSVSANNNSFDVYLQIANGAMVRSMGGQLNAANLGAIFQVGRIMRLLDDTGHLEFGIIAGSALDVNGNPVVTLAGQPAIAFRRQGGRCGIEGLGVGVQASVVSWIRYNLRQLGPGTAGYQPLFANTVAGVGDDTRRQLVREELDASLQPIAGTLEIVADYAVDLRFAFTAVTAQSTDPTLTRYPFGDATNRTFASNVATSPQTPGPERIRSIHARLTVRSREADRQAPITQVTTPAGNIFRFHLAGTLGYARARTITGEVNLPNLAGLAW